MIEPGIADLDNAPKGGFAGTITAAVVSCVGLSKTARAMCILISTGGNPALRLRAPKGGVGQGTRAILNALPEILGL